MDMCPRHVGGRYPTPGSEERALRPSPVYPFTQTTWRNAAISLYVFGHARKCFRTIKDRWKVPLKKGVLTGEIEAGAVSPGLPVRFRKIGRLKE